MSNPTAATSEPAPSSPIGDAISDSDLAADVVFGLVVGTPLVYLLVVAMCLLAGTGLGNALAVAIVPCFLSGIFFGGVLPLSRQMYRHEALERDARRRAVASIHPLIDVAEVLPAA